MQDVDVIITKYNELYVKLVISEKQIESDINSIFSFSVAGYFFMKKYKDGLWDGKINLYNINTHLFPIGLVIDLVKYFQENDITFSIDRDLKAINFDTQIEEFLIKTLPILTLEPYDYQIESFKRSIRYNKLLILSATASGKSMIIYLIVRFLLEYTDKRILISVPSSNLVKQLHGDFRDYEEDDFVYNSCVEMCLKEQNSKKRVAISTWKYLTFRDKNWIKQFGAFILDEAHQADTVSLSYIINSLTEAPFRFGLTGTLDGSKTHEMQCRSWFGSIYRSIKTKKLMELGILTKLKIQMICLQHNVEKKLIQNYKDEISYLISNKKRNEWIIKKALSFNNNTLVLFNEVEKHGLVLLDMAKKDPLSSNKKIVYISGMVSTEEREEIRKSMEERNDVILFASYGTFSTGVNVKNLHYIIFTRPYKSRIKIFQSIGRSLRTHESKDVSTVIDLCDNINPSSNSVRKNITYEHALERLNYYEQENFSVDFSEEVL